jgi:hypothetical protein
MMVYFVPVRYLHSGIPLFPIVPTLVHISTCCRCNDFIAFSDHHWSPCGRHRNVSSESISRTLELLKGDMVVEPIGMDVNAWVTKPEETIMLLSAFLIPLLTLIILRPHASNNFLWKSKKVLLVTAHPDDEALFFSPTLLAVPRGVQVFSLCLSYGDSEGLGQVRKEEFHRAMDVLKIPESRSWILNHP